ncbi:MBL fold metallo-hydrolase [Derxia lacustris]|uniref:MBL fold metallo-hydrolase n=1 Tax=Derxia lacustris TaxID=764842 RepID=UPI000A1749BD|nr:MBL fold metallo-hydrolase [Derxia lacustris]
MTDIAHGIVTLDTGYYRPAFDAAYLVVERGRAAFVDTGTTHSVPRLLAGLAAAGLEPADVDWVVLTHVHLDHAGGAGALMQALPQARLAVHPRGARHMIDPARLVAGAIEVYGAAAVERDYGRILPVPAERVVEATEGTVLELAGRPLRCLDTPGHARHHLCLFDEAGATVFTGDTFGVSYREFDGPNGAWALPSSTPIQFDAAEMCRSIERLAALPVTSIRPTHYGAVGNVPAVAALLVEQVEAMAALARELRTAPDRAARLRAGLGALYADRALAHGVPLDRAGVLALLANDIELNAQGLDVWLDQSQAVR